MSDPISLDTRGRTTDYDCHEVPVDEWSTGDTVKAWGMGIAGGGLVAGAGMALTGVGAPAAPWVAGGGVVVGGAVWAVGAVMDGGIGLWNWATGNDHETQCNPLAQGMQRPNPALAGVSLRQRSFA